MTLGKLVPLQKSGRSGQLATAQPIATWKALINFIPFEDGIAYAGAHCTPRFPFVVFPTVQFPNIRAVRLVTLPNGAWGVLAAFSGEPELRLYKLDDDLKAAAQRRVLNIGRTVDISSAIVASVHARHVDGLFRLALFSGTWKLLSSRMADVSTELQHIKLQVLERALLLYGFHYTSSNKNYMPVLYGEFGDSRYTFYDTNVAANGNTSRLSLFPYTLVWWRYAANRPPIPVMLRAQTPVFPTYAGGYCACGHLVRLESPFLFDSFGVPITGAQPQLPSVDVVTKTVTPYHVNAISSMPNPTLLELLRGSVGLSSGKQDFVYSPAAATGFAAHAPTVSVDNSATALCSLIPLPDRRGGRHFVITPSAFALADISVALTAALQTPQWANFVQKYAGLGQDLAALAASLPTAATLATGIYLPALYQGATASPLRYAFGAVSYPTNLGASLGISGDPITFAPIPELFLVDNEYAISVGGYSPPGYNSGGDPNGLTLGQGETVWGYWRFPSVGHTLDTTLQNGPTPAEKPVATVFLWDMTSLGTAFGSLSNTFLTRVGAFHAPTDLQGVQEFSRIRFSSPDSYFEWAPDLQEVSPRWLSGFLHARNANLYRATFRFLDSVYIFTDFGYIRLQKRGGAVAYTLSEADLGDIFGKWDYRSAFVNTPYGVFVITPSGLYLFDGNALRPVRQADDIIFSTQWFSSVYRHIPQVSLRQPQLTQLGPEDFGTTFPDFAHEQVSPYGMFVPEWDSVVWFIHSFTANCTIVLGYNLKTEQPFIMRSHANVWWLPVDGDEKGFVELREALMRQSQQDPTYYAIDDGLFQTQFGLTGNSWSIHPTLPGTFSPFTVAGSFGVFFAFTRQQAKRNDPNGVFPTMSAAYASTGFVYDPEEERVLTLTRCVFEGRAIRTPQPNDIFIVGEGFFALPEQTTGKAPQVQASVNSGFDTPLRVTGRYINLSIAIAPTVTHQRFDYVLVLPSLGNVAEVGMTGYIQGVRLEARARGLRRWR